MPLELFVETLYPPESLFQTWPVPFTWITIPKYFKESGWTTLIGFQPLSVFYRFPNGHVKYLAFAILSYPYSNEDKTARIHRFSTFTEKPELQKEAIKLLLNECERFARIIKAEALETELYTKSFGPISFPSGSYYLDDYNDDNIITYFSEHGFYKKEEKYCFQIDIRERKICDTEKVREIKNTEKNNEHYLNLIRKGIKLIKTNKEVVSGSNNYLTRNVFHLSDPRTMLISESGMIFKRMNGVLHWSVNLYPYYMLDGTKALYQNLDEIMKKSDLIKTGKIFSLIVEEYRTELFSNLCYAAINRMKKLNLHNCQIGEISENETEFIRFLHQEKFKIVNNLEVVRKEL